MRWIIVVALMMILLTGCKQDTDVNNENIGNAVVTDIYSTLSGGVSRVVDYDAGVVCYIYCGIEKGGISCIPISYTKLGD